MRKKTPGKKEDWLVGRWRPAMGWMYMAICGFDFMLAPILWSILQAFMHGSVTSQWQPLTLQGAGFFHIAMGAVLGISAYGRTQEKLNGVYSQPTVPQSTAPYMQPDHPPVQSSHTVTPVATSSTGKSAPIQPAEPSL